VVDERAGLEEERQRLANTASGSGNDCQVEQDDGQWKDLAMNCGHQSSDSACSLFVT
jgi:hypothetical protein